MAALYLYLSEIHTPLNLVDGGSSLTSFFRGGTRRKYGARKNSFFFNRQRATSKNAKNAIHRPSRFLNNSRAILSRKLRSLDRFRPNEIFTLEITWNECNVSVFNALKAQFKAQLGSIELFAGIFKTQVWKLLSKKISFFILFCVERVKKREKKLFVGNIWYFKLNFLSISLRWIKIFCK